MSRTTSTALPIAYVTLRILIVLNLLFGAAILVLLAYSFINEPWMMRAIGASGFTAYRWVVTAMRVIAGLGLVGILLNHELLKRLLAIIATVRRGDPFVAENAFRLNAIAWILLALQLLSLIIAVIGRAIAAHGQFRVDAGFSMPGWLAVILTFVLARVFAEGTLMRDDLEGTV